MKICCTCKLEKTIQCFSKKGKGLQSQCKQCRKTYFAKHYAENKDYYIKRAKQQDLDIMNWYKELKSKLKCDRCDETHIACLEFHHTNPDEKEMTVSAALRYSKQRAILEMAKCIVLCANCHRKEHYT